MKFHVMATSGSAEGPRPSVAARPARVGKAVSPHEAGEKAQRRGEQKQPERHFEGTSSLASVRL